MFQPLGIHHEWRPDKDANAAPLVACSSSGGQIRFTLDSSSSNCELVTNGASRLVRALQVVADCTVIASQRGNGEYAAARATQRYVVDSLRVTVEVQQPDPTKSTLKVGGSATFAVTLKATWPILLGSVGFTARPDEMVCRAPYPWRPIDSGSHNWISNTFTVDLVAAGSCDIDVLPSESQFVTASTAEVQFPVNP